VFSYYFSQSALKDIIEVLAWSEDKFGVRARLRYEELIEAAIRDIVKDSSRLGIKSRPELGSKIKTYHLTCSRKHVRDSSPIVKKPRHIIVFRFVSDKQIEIVRVLHDAMEIKKHLPDD
jgi:toxin ParE1/3/4